MVGQIVAAFGQPFFLNSPTAYSDSWFSAKARVSMTALMSLANPLGAAIGQFVNSSAVEQPEDMPKMVLYFAIIASLCCVLVVFCPQNPLTPPSPSNVHEKSTLSKALARAITYRDFWFLLIAFGTLVGLFNSFSTLISQLLTPYGYSTNDAGIVGAVLILAGIASAACTSPLVDKYHPYQFMLRTIVPFLTLCYLGLIFAVREDNYIAICVVIGIIGAASFSLLPVALELGVEILHPAPPSVSSTVYWSSSQILGAAFILGMDNMTDTDGQPPGNMRNALILQCCLSAFVVPFALLVGFRQPNFLRRKLQDDERAVYS